MLAKVKLALETVSIVLQKNTSKIHDSDYSIAMPWTQEGSFSSANIGTYNDITNGKVTHSEVKTCTDEYIYMFQYTTNPVQIN